MFSHLDNPKNSKEIWILTLSQIILSLKKYWIGLKIKVFSYNMLKILYLLKAMMKIRIIYQIRVILLIRHPERALTKKSKQKEKEKELLLVYLLLSVVMENSNFHKLLVIYFTLILQ